MLSCPFECINIYIYIYIYIYCGSFLLFIFFGWWWCLSLDSCYGCDDFMLCYIPTYSKKLIIIIIIKDKRENWLCEMKSRNMGFLCTRVKNIFPHHIWWGSPFFFWVFLLQSWECSVVLSFFRNWDPLW